MIRTMLAALCAVAAAVALACAPALAQDVRTLPLAAPLTGAEKMPSVQGTGCASKTTPCAAVAVTPSLIGAYLAPTFQAKDADLDAIAALATVDFGRQLLTKASASDARTALALGSLATQSSIADTALTGAAWTSFTPTVTASSGTYTTVTAIGRYKQVGKTVSVWLRITTTTVGTGSGLRVTLPVPSRDVGASSGYQVLTGAEVQAVGFGVYGLIDNAAARVAFVRKCDGTNPEADGRVFVLSGSYEAA